MYKHFLEHLICPKTHTSLHYDGDSDSRGRVDEGSLVSKGGTYKITKGVPHFIDNIDDDGAKQVQDVFSHYWETHKSDSVNIGRRSMSEESVRKLIQVDHLGEEAGNTEVKRYFSTKKRILDAGCGAGYVARFNRTDPSQQWYSVDFGRSVYIAEHEMQNEPNSLCIRASLFELPFKDNFFDTICSIGVLHHTPHPKEGFMNLVKHLAPGGEIFIAMIRRQVPIRNFTDAYAREYMLTRSYEENLEITKSISLLAKELQAIKGNITVPKGLEFLGIETGDYDIHRFIHAYFMKNFYSPHFTLEENMLQNIDWYSVQYAWPHTEDELKGWYEEAGLSNISIWQPSRPHEKNEMIRIRGLKPF